MPRPPRASTMLAMSTAVRPAIAVWTNAMVVYVNSAVALAVAGRLLASSSVTLATLPEALDALAGAPRVDVVVACPYLTAQERELLAQACEQREDAPPCVELVDTPGEPTTHLPSLEREPLAKTAAVGRVLDALAR
jgi:hypothetical protein